MIRLTDEEAKLLGLIKLYADRCDPPVTPRLAGGWVRDKLMNIRSHDIDIALDTCPGYRFASGLVEELDELVGGSGHGEGAYGEGALVSGVHRIQANPEKSKQLETAVVSLFGMSVDFVQLRSETYTDTRIPVAVPASPLEDALRRDLTINSLFYNLRTGEIEDLTGTGIQDIRQGILRTPLPPERTLFEDPLRILRIFRFRAKFGFKIADEIYTALESPAIRAALTGKVSQERVEMELFKMLGYKRGYLGMREILKTGYVDPVFKLTEGYSVDIDRSMNLYFRCLSIIRDSTATDTTATSTTATSDENLIIRTDLLESELAALGAAHSAGRGDRPGLLYSLIHRDLLCLYMVLCNFAGKRVRDGKKEEYLNALAMRDGLKSSKEQFSRVRGLETAIDYVRTAGHADTADTILHCREYAVDALLILAATTTDSEKYIRIMTEIIDQRRYDCYRIIPLVTGHDLKHVSRLEIRGVLHRCLLYQIGHPEASKEEILGQYGTAHCGVDERAE